VALNADDVGDARAAEFRCAGNLGRATQGMQAKLKEVTP
jgi:hypothetical protein